MTLQQQLAYKSISNTLLIVGNGLDLSLKLPTSYADFLKSDYFMSNYTPHTNDLIDEILDAYQVANWVDIEKELGRYCQNLYRKENEDGIFHLKHEYGTLCHWLHEYLLSVDKINLDISEDNPTIRLLQDLYLRLDTPIPVVTFNYTHTLERINDRPGSGIKTDILHVHGELDIDKNISSIVFGVEDSQRLRQSHQFLYKSHSKHTHSTKFFNRLNNAQNIIFFGYSLGETDHSYFEDFFESLLEPVKSEKNLIFYYYQDEDRDNIMWMLRKLTKEKFTQLNMYNNVVFLPCEPYHNPFKDA